MDNRSREELIMWLTQIIDNEVNKSDDQMDMDLILECSDYLDELQKEKNFYKEQDILQKIAIIKQRVENSAKHEESVRIIRTKRRVPLYKKILIAVAAALLIAISTLAVVARVQNYDSVLAFLKDHIDQIKRMSANETLEDNDISVSKAENTVWYDSIEELLATEGIIIFLPDADLSDYAVKSICKSDIGNGRFYILVLFENTDGQIIVYNYLTSNYSNWSANEIYVYKNIDFYIFVREGMYHASCQYNGYEYTITSDTRDSLIEIINNLKEYEP